MKTINIQEREIDFEKIENPKLRKLIASQLLCNSGSTIMEANYDDEYDDQYFETGCYTDGGF